VRIERSGIAHSDDPESHLNRGRFVPIVGTVALEVLAMTLSPVLLADPTIALDSVGAIEAQLGADVILTVGIPRPSIVEVLADGELRAVALSFSTGDAESGSFGLVVTRAFGARLEAVAADEMLVTTCRPALEAAAQSLGALTSQRLELARPSQQDPSSLVDADEVVVFPILEGLHPVGALVVTLGAAVATTEPQAAPDAPVERETQRTARMAHPIAGELVLAGVDMGVTAELGRCRMTMRDFLSLTPGAVIDLDQLANQPVDVLVNGTPIARGEVVVIDDEFAIRISEIFQHAT
jgi:flagellar motor switch protein FliN/FliY